MPQYSEDDIQSLNQELREEILNDFYEQHEEWN